ncbi:MAG: hypothetical protein ABI667_09645 [Sphingomicrobium sp.]
MKSLITSLSFLAAPLSAQTIDERSAKARQELTKTDVEAAATLLEKSQPGAAQELGDVGFQSLLKAAKQNAFRGSGRSGITTTIPRC